MTVSVFIFHYPFYAMHKMGNIQGNMIITIKRDNERDNNMSAYLDYVGRFGGSDI